MSPNIGRTLALGLLLLTGCGAPRLLREVLDEPLRALPPAPAAALDALVLEGSGTGWFASSLFEAADLPKQAFDALRQPALAEAPWEPWLRTLAAARLAADNPAFVGDPVGAVGLSGPWEDLRLAALAELREVRGLGLAQSGATPERGQNPLLPQLRVAGPFPLDPAQGLDTVLAAAGDTMLAPTYALGGLSLPTFEVEQAGGMAEIATRGMGLYLVEAWVVVEREGRAVVSVTADSPLRIELQQSNLLRVDRDRRYEGDRSNAWVELGRGTVRIRAVIASATGQLRLGLRITPTADEGARLAPAEQPAGPARASVSLLRVPDPVRELRAALAEALYGGLLPKGASAPLWWFEFAHDTGDEELLHALASRDNETDAPLQLWRRANAYAELPWFAETERAHLARALLEQSAAGWEQDTLPETALAKALAADGRARAARKRLAELPGLQRSPAALLALGGLLRDEGDFDAANRLLLQGLGSVPAPCRLASELVAWRESEGAFAASAALPAAIASCEAGRVWRLEHESLAHGRFQEAFEEARALSALRPGDLERARRQLLLSAYTGNPADRAETLQALERRFAEPAILASLLAAEAPARAPAIAALQHAAEAAPTDLRRELAAFRLGLPSLTPEVATRSARILAARKERTEQVVSGATYLLDAMDVRIASDGSALTLVHQIIELGTRDSLDELGEVNLPGEAELLLARSIKPDGAPLPVADTAGKDSLSFANLEVGDLIEVAYLLESRPFAPEVWAPTPRFMFRAPSAHFIESSVSYDFPESWEKGLIVDVRFANPPAVTRADGRVHYAFVEHDMQPYRTDEPSAPEEEFVPSVAIARNFNMQSWLLWRMRWQWFDEVAPARLLAAVTGGLPAGSDEATLRTLFRWVNTTVLPADDWAQPTGFASILRQRGDRSAALRLLLASRGFKAAEVALRSIDADPVSRPLFDNSAWGYRALRVDLSGRSYWLDPEDDDAVFNLLPRSVQGSVAIDQRSPDNLLQVPVAPRATWQNRIQATLTLGADGSVQGALTESVPLSDAAAFRRFVHAVPDAQERLQRSERRLSRTFPSIALSELTVDGLDALDAPLSVRYAFTAQGFARAEASRLHYEGALFARPLAQAFATAAERSSPLRAEAYLDETVRIEFRPPVGFRLARLPDPVSLDCAGLSFHRTAEQGGELLTIEHTITAPYRYIAASDYPAFATCAASIEEAQRLSLDWSR